MDILYSHPSSRPGKSVLQYIEQVPVGGAQMHCMLVNKLRLQNSFAVSVKVSDSENRHTHSVRALALLEIIGYNQCAPSLNTSEKIRAGAFHPHLHDVVHVLLSFAEVNIISRK